MVHHLKSWVETVLRKKYRSWVETWKNGSGGNLYGGLLVITSHRPTWCMGI